LVSSEATTRRRATIWQVAALAGVSQQTVSRYLRSQGAGMKESTRERVSAAIAELNYRPNLIARAMRSRKTGRLALLLPNGAAASSLEMLAGATEEARQAGYVVELVTLGGPAETRIDRALELADSGLFEGIASLTPLLLTDLPEGASTTPIVVSPEFDHEMRSIGELADAAPIAEIIDHLAQLGHRRFMHMAGDYAYTSARSRRQVYLDTLERLGLESYAVVDCDWSAARAREAVLQLPADCGVTAIIGANDTVAAGAMRGAWDRGWSVPGDLSVTGWDNNPVAAVLAPTLTSVAVDYVRLGRDAVTRLVSVLRGEPEPVADHPVVQVLWRESTGSPLPDAGHSPQNRDGCGDRHH
jgi:DNA-binding LacI/PurR family transcriptional regulator